jgi:hypothetical protein
MKTIKIIAALIFTVITLNCVSAQNHSYKAQNISSKGEIMDKNQKSLGKIEKDGTIKDAQGGLLGNIASDGTITDKNGVKMGKAQKNGDFWNAKGEQVIFMSNTGEAKDSKGHILYKTSPDYAMQSCAIQCFFGGDCCSGAPVKK